MSRLRRLLRKFFYLKPQRDLQDHMIYVTSANAKGQGQLQPNVSAWICFQYRLKLRISNFIHLKKTLDGIQIKYAIKTLEAIS